MSLAIFLQDAAVRNRFRREFPKPKGGVPIVPAIPRPARMLAPPLSSNYGLTGTAFDYLLRFYVKKLNAYALDRTWVAGIGLALLGGHKDKVYLKAKRIFDDAQSAYARYLKASPRAKPGTKLIRAAIGLTQLEAVYRIGIVDETFGRVPKKVVEDLRRLLGVVEPSDFTGRRKCILNPHFGKASQLVAGADADLIIDRTLIDIKTTSHLWLDREMFNQLIGYYLLSRIGGIDGCPGHRVDSLGVYYARYGVFRRILVSEVIREKDVPRITRWIKRYAAKLFPRALRPPRYAKDWNG